MLNHPSIMSPARNVSLGFNYITGVDCKRENYKLHRTLDHTRPDL